MNFLYLSKRKLFSFKNSIFKASKWKVFKNFFFLFSGLGLMSGLYFSFVKLLNYLNGVELIGEMLIWKLTSMVFLMSFAMIMISSVVISMTTLYYSFDLKFLISSPIRHEIVFLDKSADTVFYSSWTLLAAMIPYVLALMKIKGLGFGFLLGFIMSVIPFIALGAVFGIALSLFVMYAFPSSRTRDITWILGSLSIAFVYVAFRLAKPEQLIRPDTLEIVARYISFLQAPTAAYLPSWWLTEAMMKLASGKNFYGWLGILYAAMAIVYFALYKASSKFYMRGISGAQNTRKFKGGLKYSFEQRLAKIFPKYDKFLYVFMKERKIFSRDVRYWSQVILIIALVFVYIFSIRNLPLDTPDMKSFICFLNIGAAGFVISAVALRFLFPAISMESNSFWILKSSPIKMESVFYAKLVFYGIPAMILSFILTAFSNYFLSADSLIFAVSVFSIVVMSFTISVMAISLGAVYPDFRVENIHKVESSYGGFLFMAIAMAYIVLVMGILSGPVQMHFMSRFNPDHIFEIKWLYLSLFAVVAISFSAASFVWSFALRRIEKYEI